MESGAILLYLGQKFGKFICEGNDYWQMVQWLMWQMGGFGPILGQTHHFLKFNAGVSDYAEKRFGDEAARLYRVLNTQLEGRDFVAGDGRGMYSVADMAIWPWASRFEWQGVDLADMPNVRDWYVRVAERPAVQSGYHIPKFTADIPMP